MFQSHPGKTCPYCQFPIKGDSNLAICSQCGIPHHLECWQENGKCTTFGCRGEMSKEISSQEVLDITLKEPPKVKGTAPISEKTGRLIALLLVCGVVLLGVLIFFVISNSFVAPLEEADHRSAAQSKPEEGENLMTEEKVQEVVPVITKLDADYYIDYENGTVPLGDLSIGARVVDPTWEWEFRTGSDYSLEAGDETKSVTWIIVAKDHYEELEPHVTLLSEELIGKHGFDNSTKQGHELAEWGYNHWGKSGTADATRGLRPWLNSSGLHSGEGFYRTFSEDFKGAVVNTILPNKEWETGNSYYTNDYVFIPSKTELGDSNHSRTYPIGAVYPYFSGSDDARRVAHISGRRAHYWTRSPKSNDGSSVNIVNQAGQFLYFLGGGHAHNDRLAARPALNLKSEILVSEIDNR